MSFYANSQLAIDKMFTDKITVICMYTKKQIDKEYVCKDMFSLSQSMQKSNIVTEQVKKIDPKILSQKSCNSSSNKAAKSSDNFIIFKYVQFKK